MACLRLIFQVFGASFLATSVAEPWRPSIFSALVPDGLENIDEAYVIGDLHADIDCARRWVQASGLIDITSSPLRWTGSSRSALVFMGDYVDKGPDGRQVLEFVRSITEAFPRQVIALMGNHDLYLLFDTFFKDGASQFMGVPVKDFAHAFTNPLEYFNWMPSTSLGSDVKPAFDALMEGFQHVYNQRLEGRVLLDEYSGSLGMFSKMPPFKNNRDLAISVKSLLRAWQENMYRELVNTGLAHWISRRPLAAAIGDVIFVHGGLSNKGVQALMAENSNNATAVVNRIAALSSAFQEVFRDNFQPASLSGPFSGLANVSTSEAALVNEVVTYRGLHKSCAEVDAVLTSLAVDRRGKTILVVGHTPGKNIRISCGNRFASMDSTLSRHFRAHGNRYCDRVRPDGEACSREVSHTCPGQIGRLTYSDGDWSMAPVELPPEFATVSKPLAKNQSDVLEGTSTVVEQNGWKASACAAVIFLFFVFCGSHALKVAPKLRKE